MRCAGCWHETTALPRARRVAGLALSCCDRVVCGRGCELCLPRPRLSALFARGVAGLHGEVHRRSSSRRTCQPVSSPRQAWATRVADAGGVCAWHRAGRASPVRCSRCRPRAAPASWRGMRRASCSNLLRSVPELVWAALMVLAAGHRAFRWRAGPGAAHHRACLGRLFAEALQNAPPRPGAALRARRHRAGRGLRLRQPAGRAAAVGGLRAATAGR